MKELAWSGEAVFRFLSYFKFMIGCTVSRSLPVRRQVKTLLWNVYQRIFQPQCAAICPWSQQLWICASGSRYPLPLPLPLPLWFQFVKTNLPKVTFCFTERLQCLERMTTLWPLSPILDSSSLAPLLFVRRKGKLSSLIRGVGQCHWKYVWVICVIRPPLRWWCRFVMSTQNMLKMTDNIAVPRICKSNLS